MKSGFIVLACWVSVMQANAQNVGIGTTTPAHKLDVKGNVNISGNLLTNGVAGQANQVLSTDNLGNTVWASTGEYSNHLTFTSTGGSSWTVPAGVTKIMVEAWGGGGGGSTSGGGGGGGYITGYFNVIPGATVSYTIGSGGLGVTSGITSQNHGTNSTITVNTITLTAFGGGGSYQYSSTGYWLGRGGSFAPSSNAFTNWAGVPGEDGKPNQINFIQPTGSTIWETTLGGGGGNAGNTMHTAASGGYAIYNMTSGVLLKYVTPGRSGRPGGGGSGNLEKGATYYGSSGENGMVRIHY